MKYGKSVKKKNGKNGKGGKSEFKAFTPNKSAGATTYAKQGVKAGAASKLSVAGVKYGGA